MTDNTFLTGIEYLKKFPGFKLEGRDAELENLCSILLRGYSSSVILSGAGGVGCSAMSLGIQASKSEADAPFDIFSKRLWWLNTDELFGDDNPNVVTDKIKRFIGVLNMTPNSVLIIDKTRTFLDACRSANTWWLVHDLINMIRERTIQVILETRDDSLDMVLSAHSDIKELFTLVTIDEPKGPALLQIVKRAASTLEQHHAISMDEDAICAAIELTNKYAASDGFNRAQPDRAVTLLDRSLSSLRLSAHRHPPEFEPADWERIQNELKGYHREVRDGEIAINRFRDEIRMEQEKMGSEHMSGMRTGEHEAKYAKIDTYQAEVDSNRQKFDNLTRKINARIKLDRVTVLREFSSISGISADRLQENDVEKLKTLEPALLQRIYGQDEAVSHISNAFKVAGLGNREDTDTSPQFAFLLLGSSGVGKTEIAKACSAHMYGDERALIRFDMSEFSEKNAAAKLIGAPPGYEGYSEGGILTNIARKRKRGILLFDEIEKGHPDVYNIFLQLLSDGRLTDNHGRTETFEGFGIFMTTNIGQNHFLNPEISFEEATNLAIMELGQTYKNEFLNRFAGRHNIIGFRPLGPDTIERIVLREFKKLCAGYLRKGVDLRAGPSCLADFCHENYDPTSGARGLPGFIKVNLESKVVNLLLDGGFDKACPQVVQVDYSKAKTFTLTRG